jgi:hypothetical protein
MTGRWFVQGESRNGELSRKWWSWARAFLGTQIKIARGVDQAELNARLRAKCAIANSCWFGQLEAMAK